MRKALFALGSILGMIPGVAWAFDIPGDWSTPVCAFIPCNGFGGAGGAVGLQEYLSTKIVPAMEVIFVAVAALVLLFKMINMIMYAEQESAITEGKLTFVYTIAGGAIVAFAHVLANAFAPGANATVIDVAATDSAIAVVYGYFKLLLAAMLAANIVIQGIRFVASRGQDEKIKRARTLLLYGFIGVAIVIMANTLAVALNPELSGSSGGSTVIALEIAGIANYLITILGFAAVVAIIAAGFMLVISVDESLKDKAKTIIKGAIITLLVVLASYALVTAFI